ncbi:hypothetical protein EH165_07360 [Nakamurella antarctica]|uniref:ABC transporter permease n=1 Tax=Nakamurella antarctica TaxID=1902245 RepID=A0A3G8ZU33_9ACTN|nr:ABC transporter permease subunit [Nakamurella antarctica]AZI57984.1 hypothetical protein EH165_07360 [Nakamurella antarctica]
MANAPPVPHSPARHRGHSVGLGRGATDPWPADPIVHRPVSAVGLPVNGGSLHRLRPATQRSLSTTSAAVAVPAPAPCPIGAFWGAPLLAREYERGTYKLVWTQTVSRQKWLTVKLSVIGAAAAVGGLALGLMISAWLSVFRGTTFPGVYPDRSFFELRGIVPAGWWLFSFMIGAAAGAVIRRTLPAMAVTIVLAVALLMSFNSARDYVYAAPDQLVVTTLPVSAAIPVGSSYVDSWWLDPQGNARSEVAVQRDTATTCPQIDPQVLPDSCLMGHGYRAVVLFQPPTRWWRYQLTEDAILLLASLLAGALIVAAGRSRKRSVRSTTSVTQLSVAAGPASF